jgi:predicted RNase H-like nuclease (RuvC/YqgF family)
MFRERRSDNDGRRRNDSNEAGIILHLHEHVGPVKERVSALEARADEAARGIDDLRHEIRENHHELKTMIVQSGKEQRETLTSHIQAEDRVFTRLHESISSVRRIIFIASGVVTGISIVWVFLTNLDKLIALFSS